jgi:hypothetical protein
MFGYGRKDIIKYEQKFILFLICIVIKLTYLKNIIRYFILFYFSLYWVFKLIILIKRGLTWRVDPGPKLVRI